jgi:hypothetical protein
LAGVAIGSVIGWGLTAIKKNAQIAQIREDTRKASGENIAKLAQMRDIANSKQQVLDMARQNMRDALLASKGGQIMSINSARAAMNYAVFIQTTTSQP